MSETKTQVKAEILGRITTEPELRRSSAGVAVCRFTVATDAGPASSPVVKRVYVLGRPGARPAEDLAVRCRNLGVGDLVLVPGIERQRMRTKNMVTFPEAGIEATDVRLRERAGGGGGGA